MEVTDDCGWVGTRALEGEGGGGEGGGGKVEGGRWRGDKFTAGGETEYAAQGLATEVQDFSLCCAQKAYSRKLVGEVVSQTAKRPANQDGGLQLPPHRAQSHCILDTNPEWVVCLKRSNPARKVIFTRTWKPPELVVASLGHHTAAQCSTHITRTK